MYMRIPHQTKLDKRELEERGFWTGTATQQILTSRQTNPSLTSLSPSQGPSSPHVIYIPPNRQWLNFSVSAQPRLPCHLPGTTTPEGKWETALRKGEFPSHSVRLRVRSCSSGTSPPLVSCGLHSASPHTALSFACDHRQKGVGCDRHSCLQRNWVSLWNLPLLQPCCSYWTMWLPRLPFNVLSMLQSGTGKRQYQDRNYIC